MPRKLRLVLLVSLCCLSLLEGQSQTESKLPTVSLVKAGHVLDVNAGRYLDNAGILIKGDRIVEVGPFATVQSHAPQDFKLIDLGSAYLLPGLIDCHTHLMARSEEGPNGYVLDLATKSQAFRALEGAADARVTLEAGFTTVRDVENEGSGFADVALREAINHSLVPGPRMQVATRGIAAVGQYFPFGVSSDLANFPTGAQMISGVEDARRAARDQIGHGADLIKVYADWMHPTLTVEEIRTVVEEAHKAGIKVAAHATTAEGIRNAVTAGVDSIEHGHGADRQDLELMRSKGVFWVPTIGHYYVEAQRKDSPPALKDMLDRVRQNFAIARELGVKIANGFDAGSAEDHGHNAEEIIAMTKLGVPAIESLRAATSSTALLMGWQDRIGSLQSGHCADIIATAQDPLVNIEELRQIGFVMRGGVVVKDPLRPVTDKNP